MTTLSDIIETKYPKGKIISGKVNRVLTHGAEIVLEDGTVGFIRNRELAWEYTPRDPFDIVKCGQTIQAMVTRIDRDRGRLELSLRQAGRDPWNDIETRYQVGQVVRRPVARLWKTGIFVELEPGVDGFVSLHDIMASPPEHIGQILWVGDTIEATIVRLDCQERHVLLSIRECLKRREGEQTNTIQLDDTSNAYSLIEALRPRDRQRIAQLLSECRAEEAGDGEAESKETFLVKRFPKILISEDDASFRGSLARLLTRLGHRVDTVERAEKAIARCSAEHYDLILLDIDFGAGEIDGAEAARRILSNDSSVPIIMITDVTWLERHTHTIGAARQAGAKSALIKPIALSQLHHVMYQISSEQDAWGEAEIPAQLNRARAVFAPSKLGLASEVDLRQRVLGLLEELQLATGANSCMLFKMEPATRNVAVFAYCGQTPNVQELSEQMLRSSPVDQVIRQNQTVFDSDITANPLKYRHLQLLEFSSCIGLPVRSEGQNEFGLFLFHPQRNGLVDTHLERAQSTAELLGPMILQAKAERILQNIQPYLFIGQLGSSLMHELNNRLGVLEHFSELLSREYGRLAKEPEVALEARWRAGFGAYVDEITDHSRKIRTLSKLFLGLVGPEVHEAVNVNQIVRRAAEFLRPHAESSQVHMATLLAEDMPTTMSFATRLEQICLNIMLNAIQQTYLAKAGGELVVRTSFESGDLPIKIRFTDTGPGIHFQLRRRIFDLGFSTRSDGTGIGLFLTRGLVASLGGRLKIEESVMLVGTTFCVELPMVVPSVEEGTRG